VDVGIAIPAFLPKTGSTDLQVGSTVRIRVVERSEKQVRCEMAE
jgi:hypothetical protein